MNESHQHSHKERKTGWVVLLTFVTMVVEIIFGLITNSMGLLADGIHMGSHVLAIGLSYGTYAFIRRIQSNAKIPCNSEKVLSLSGFTSGILLFIFALAISYEALIRFQTPLPIQFKEAIVVATVGLIINLISAVLLHHDHGESDHNIKAAYLHVLADAVTSVAAIAGLAAAWLWDLRWLDPAVAILGALVIIKWSLGLLVVSGKTLIDWQETDSHS